LGLGLVLLSSQPPAFNLPSGYPPQFIYDRRHSPLLAPSQPVGSTYVDNTLILAFTKDEYQRVFDIVCKTVQEDGFTITSSDVSQLIHHVGLELSLSTRIVRTMPERIWCAYKTSRCLCSMCSFSAKAMERLFGNVVNIFMCMRPALACLDQMYLFEALPPGHHPIPPAPRIELRTI
jgi:hypothetical protein